MMSKVIPISPEAVPDKNEDDMIVTLRVADLRAIVRQAVRMELDSRQPQVPRIAHGLKGSRRNALGPADLVSGKSAGGGNQIRSAGPLRYIH
jgi:hypothetical protein